MGRTGRAGRHSHLSQDRGDSRRPGWNGIGSHERRRAAQNRGGCEPGIRRMWVDPARSAGEVAMHIRAGERPIRCSESDEASMSNRDDLASGRDCTRRSCGQARWPCVSCAAALPVSSSRRGVKSCRLWPANDFTGAPGTRGHPIPAFGPRATNSHTSPTPIAATMWKSRMFSRGVA